MTGNPTMIDVAREADVALKTVSRFVNGETNINPAMAERIAAAIAKLGYRRNLAAASIRPGWTSKTIGLIISDLANPYYSTLARAIEGTAREQGYLVISASSDEDGAQHDRLVDRLLEQRVDALIIVPPRDAGRAWSDLPPPLPPLVFLDRPVDFASSSVILADNIGGAGDATSALLAEGARRIAFVGDSLAIHTMDERHAGYLTALRRAGIPDEASLTVVGAHSSDEATAAVSALLREDPSVDAVFAANNRATIGALRAFREVGRRPALIGFDDFEAAQLYEPGVSVVTHDVSEMGALAARVVLRSLSGSPAEPETHVLPTRLIFRGSEKL